MIAIQDLALLLDVLEQTEHPIAAVVDQVSVQMKAVMKNFYGNADFGDFEYVNSGLLIMDLDVLRDEDFSKRTIDWLINQPTALLPDQDCINLVYKDNITVLGPKFAWYSFNKVPEDNDIFILHYVGSSGKPWKNTNTTNAEYYFKSRNLSPWRNAPLTTSENKDKFNEFSSHLYSAIHKSKYEDVANYLSWGRNPNVIVQKNTKTALYEAVKSGNERIVKLLLEAYADYRIPNKYKELPIHKAAQWNQAKILEILLDYGANPFITNSSGETALDKAKAWNAVEALQVLEKYRLEHTSNTCKREDYESMLHPMVKECKK
tara:strand:- start:5063 stop:6019 length:957 start_codon:yes stop_codon:yes gene_type:complete